MPRPYIWTRWVGLVGVSDGGWSEEDFGAVVD